MDKAARRRQLVAMGGPEPWTRHHVERLDRPVHTYRPGDRVRVHGLTALGGPLRQTVTDGEVVQVDAAWPRYLVDLGGWSNWFRPDEMEPAATQETLF